MVPVSDLLCSSIARASISRLAINSFAGFVLERNFERYLTKDLTHLGTGYKISMGTEDRVRTTCVVSFSWVGEAKLHVGSERYGSGALVCFRFLLSVV